VLGAAAFLFVCYRLAACLIITALGAGTMVFTAIIALAIITGAAIAYAIGALLMTCVFTSCKSEGRGQHQC